MNDTSTVTITATDLQVPSLWIVKALNDDFTPMDFVVMIFTDVFNKSIEEAAALTMAIHNDGSAVVGTYTKDVAESKVQRAMRMAEEEEHPFRVLAQQG